MKRALIYLALVAFLALLVIALERPFESRVARNADTLLLPDYNTDDVAFLEIAQLTEGVKLKREGVNWIASDVITPLKEELYENEGKIAPSSEWMPADKTRVASALGSLVGLPRGVLVSASIGRQELYQVGQVGVHATTLDSKGKVIFDIVIGKNGPDFMSNYVRFFEGNDVYLVGRVLTGIFSPRLSDWAVQDLPSEAPSN